MLFSKINSSEVDKAATARATMSLLHGEDMCPPVFISQGALTFEDEQQEGRTSRIGTAGERSVDESEYGERTRGTLSESSYLEER